jgi:transcriptional regulator with XRE-family HTH domain
MRYSKEKILARRKELDLTQDEVASRAKITIATLSTIENGHKQYVKPDTIEALAGALRCQPAELLM